MVVTYIKRIQDPLSKLKVSRQQSLTLETLWSPNQIGIYKMRYILYMPFVPLWCVDNGNEIIFCPSWNTCREWKWETFRSWRCFMDVSLICFKNVVDRSCIHSKYCKLIAQVLGTCIGALLVNCWLYYLTYCNSLETHHQFYFLSITM